MCMNWWVSLSDNSSETAQWHEAKKGTDDTQRWLTTDNIYSGCHRLYTRQHHRRETERTFKYGKAFRSEHAEFRQWCLDNFCGELTFFYGYTSAVFIQWPAFLALLLCSLSLSFRCWLVCRLKIKGLIRPDFPSNTNTFSYAFSCSQEQLEHFWVRTNYSISGAEKNTVYSYSSHILFKLWDRT